MTYNGYVARTRKQKPGNSRTINIRMRESLAQKIEAMAATEQRSRNGQIIYLLEQALLPEAARSSEVESKQLRARTSGAEQ